MIFRPNATDFQRNINIITSDDGFRNHNWGDSLGYGGYYGASTIQVRWKICCMPLKALDGVYLNTAENSRDWRVTIMVNWPRTDRSN